MASGGHYPNPRTNSAPANNRPRVDNDGENENPGPPWLLTANNLSLHTSAAENRLSKKQRNKTKPKLIPVTDTSPSSESSPQASGGHRSGPKLSQPVKLSLYHKKDDIGENSHYSKMASDLDQDGSDTDESGAEPLRNFKYPVNQRRQKKNIHNGFVQKKAAENLPNISNKQDNTNKLVLRSQLGNLDQMLEQLKSEESEQLELLQQVLATRTSSSARRNEPPALDSSSSTIEYEPEPAQLNDNEDEEEDDETSEAVEKRNELLQKMVASQKKLVALKEQQTALLNMQKKAESRLAEVKAFHEQLLEAGQSNDVEYNGLLSLIQSPSLANGDANRSRNSSAPMARVSSGTPEWDLAVNQNSTQVAKGNKLHRKEIKKSSSGGSVNQALSSLNTGEIQNLHSRLRALQEFANNQPVKDEPSSNPADDQSMVISDSNRKKLENKLRELQEKKNQMDNLLAELSMHVTTQVNPVPDVPLDSNQASGVNINTEFSAETDNAIAEARQYIESVNSIEKNKQMDDLKKKLKQLKLLTENIEVTTTLEDDNRTHANNSQWRGRYPVNKRDKSQGQALKSDNLRRDHTAPGFPARRHYEAEGRANEDGDNTMLAPIANAAVAVTNTAVSPSTPLTMSQEQSIMEEHAEIEGKVTKLLVAKNKLEKLQSLLGAVHQFRQSGEQLPNDIVQFIATLQPGFEGLNDLSPADGNRTMEDDDSHRNLPNEDLARLNDVEDQLMRQQHELDHLAEERKRLLTMQEKLKILQQHQNAAAASGKNNEQRSSGEGGSVSKKDRNSSNLLAAGPVGDNNRSSRTRIAREDNLQRSRACSIENTHATKDTNSKAANSVNVSRNHPVKYESQPASIDERSLAQLHDELSQSLALRDELQHQKVVLQELLRQEQSKQMGFSQNQDLRSQSGSSEKSELVEGGSSVLAPDTTVAATWGGSSTQDNLDDEAEDEPLESLEEQDEDEGSDTTELKQTDARVQQLLQPFVEEESMIDSEMNRQRRSVRQCRVHGYKRGLLNQWRKNFQPPSVIKKNEQVAYQQPRQENIQPEVPLVEDHVEPANSDGRRRQFTKFFQQQLDQTNTLCQNVLKDQQALSGMLLSCSVSNQPMLAGQANPPDMMRYYSQMFQQQQQLLLSLSHCYHLLYLQQLEIFQLHQYIQQSSESEGAMPHSSPNDEFNFRPWCMTPWLNPQTLQTPFMPPITTPFCFNTAPPHSAPPPSFPLNSGGIVQSQVTPTAAQDERGATETLNNQVPPGSRANNFLDNFRSYSRQNLLSGVPSVIPTKSNESSVAGTSTSTIPSQIRPSYTFCATSESPKVPRARDFPNFPGSYSLPSMPNSGRKSSTPSVSPQANNNGARPRTKRPNLNQEQGNRRTSGCLNLLDAGETSRQNSRSSSISQDHSHTTNLTSVMPETLITSKPVEFETTPQPENLETLRDSIYMEVTSLISNYEQQPEMLADLLKQLQKIGSSSNNQSWKALTTIKEFMQLQDVNNVSSGVKRKSELRNKVPTTHNLMSLSEFARARLPETPHSSNNNIFTRENVENTAVRLSERINESPVDESSSSSASLPKNSTTGAIQKKYSRHFVCSANNHSFNAATSESSQETSSTSLDHQVKQAILNLVPYLQNHLLEDCTLHLQAQLCSHVMNALQSLPVHQQSLRFFRSQLLQTMQQTLAKYLGKRVRDCEEDMLMELTEVVLKELSLHKIMRKKKDENHADWLVLDNNSLSNRNETANHGALLNSESASGARIEFDSPQSHEGRFLGSEGLSENELFNNEVKNVVSDHRDWTEAADVNHGQVSESSVESSSQRSRLDIQPDRLDVRAAPDGIAAAPTLVLPVSPRLLEEESGYDCDAEGETEPEVEAENDDTKNLAEADQSAGQIVSLNDRLPHCLRDCAIGAVSSSLRNPIRSLSPHNTLNDERHDVNLVNGEIVSMEDNGAVGAEALSQGQTSAAEGEELSLDDIPTKLETLTPDELRRQIADEQASNSIIQEIVSDSHSIVGDKDNAKDPGAL